MKNHKIVVFDLDGVLVDNMEIGKQSIFYQYPGITHDIYKDLHNGNFHEELSKVTIPKRKETEEEETLRKQKYSEVKSRAPFYDGMLELLFELHSKGIIIALNSSAYNRACLPVFERQNIMHLFDFIGTADVSKSKVEKFKMIKEKYAASGDDMIFVTDTLGDIKEADTSGIPTVAVTWGVHDRKYFAREEHLNVLGIVDTVAELKDFIYS